MLRSAWICTHRTGIERPLIDSIRTISQAESLGGPRDAFGTGRPVSSLMTDVSLPRSETLLAKRPSRRQTFSMLRERDSEKEAFHRIAATRRGTGGRAPSGTTFWFQNIQAMWRQSAVPINVDKRQTSSPRSAGTSVTRCDQTRSWSSH